MPTHCVTKARSHFSLDRLGYTVYIGRLAVFANHRCRVLCRSQPIGTAARPDGQIARGLGQNGRVGVEILAPGQCGELYRGTPALPRLVRQCHVVVVDGLSVLCQSKDEQARTMTTTAAATRTFHSGHWVHRHWIHLLQLHVLVCQTNGGHCQFFHPHLFSILTANCRLSTHRRQESRTPLGPTVRETVALVARWSRSRGRCGFLLLHTAPSSSGCSHVTIHSSTLCGGICPGHSG
mmetsp:Transcript_28695/g.78845  ORF Transcript_28695/g.78845 Transcript_28695/m.78845 type:complete len:236 (+) Transcript_28695:548-1255(+)